jgi:hypothetical protein
MVKYLGSGLLLVACGNQSTNLDASIIDANDNDVDATPGDAWWTQFDVGPFPDAERAPRVNEYPPYDGKPCWQDDQADFHCRGRCDGWTGWCCRGKVINDECVCGLSPGCAPPTVCCEVLPEASVPSCTAELVCPQFR